MIFIAGPCVIESRDHAMFMASALLAVFEERGLEFIFKASYDKANRTSSKSYRGPGLDRGLEILSDVRESFGVRVISDVHDVGQVKPAAEVLDVVQIPAFLCRQTDLLVAAASTGKTVNVKKGQFLSPWDAGNIVRKIAATGGECWLTERGSSFGYNNLVVDFRSIPIMKEFGCPVIFDATHSVQRPGSAGHQSTGDPEYIETLASCGVAAGADGVFMEVHDNPGEALSDGANSLNLSDLPSLIDRLLRLELVCSC